MKTSKLRKPGLVLLVIGVVLLWFSGKDFLTSLKAPVDLNEAGFTADQVEEGMHVKTDIYAALDTFASEETWTENKDGSSTPRRDGSSILYYPRRRNGVYGPGDRLFRQPIFHHVRHHG